MVMVIRRTRFFSGRLGYFIAALPLLAAAGCMGSVRSDDHGRSLWWPDDDRQVADSGLVSEAASSGPGDDGTAETHGTADAELNSAAVRRSVDDASPRRGAAAMPTSEGVHSDVGGGWPTAMEADLRASNARVTAEQSRLLEAQLQALQAAAAAAGTRSSDISLAQFITTQANPSSPAENNKTHTDGPDTDRSAENNGDNNKTDTTSALSSKPAELGGEATPDPGGQMNAAEESTPADTISAAKVSETSAPGSSADATSGAAASEPAKPPTPAATSNHSAETSAAPAVETPVSGQWRTDLQKSIEGLEREIAAATAADERQRLETALRLLYVAANQRDAAVKPIPEVTQEMQEFWKLCMAGLLELLDPQASPIADRRAKLALRHFQPAMHHLGAASSLDVRNLAICRRVESFGSYVEFDPYEFAAGQEVILYVEVSNFAVESKPDGYETEIQGSYQILDGQGNRVADYDLVLDKQVSRNVRTDYFLPYRIFLPDNVGAGQYRIQLTLEDKKGRKFGQTPPVAFSIR
jgi:hypothetical protein